MFIGVTSTDLRVVFVSDTQLYVSKACTIFESNLQFVDVREDKS
jgi:hypothetical protein